MFPWTRYVIPRQKSTSSLQRTGDETIFFLSMVTGIFQRNRCSALKYPLFYNSFCRFFDEHFQNSQILLIISLFFLSFQQISNTFHKQITFLSRLFFTIIIRQCRRSMKPCRLINPFADRGKAYSSEGDIKRKRSSEHAERKK